MKPPRSNLTWNIKMLAFVDDKRHYVNLILKHHKESLEEAMNRSVNMWDKILTFVGGKLEISKCGFYTIQWSFDENEKPIINENKSNVTFKAQDISINSKKPQHDDALTYLGVILQPSGDQSEETTVLINKAENIAQQLSSIHLSQYYSNVYLQCSVNPKLTYLLAASSLSSKQLSSIQQKNHPEILASTGFN